MLRPNAAIHVQETASISSLLIFINLENPVLGTEFDPKHYHQRTFGLLHGLKFSSN